MVQLIESDGWRHVRTTGSYRHYNWAAYVPDLPGCITTGKTIEETERNIRETIQGHLQTLRESGEIVPAATGLAKEIEISPAA